MSRLDDELKVAFARQEPSPDFAARVLARLNDAPAVQARPSLWQRLSQMLTMPAWRYAAITAVFVLLILIGIALWRAPRTTSVDTVAIAPGKAAAEHQAAQEKSNASDVGPGLPDRSGQALANPPGTQSEAARPPRAVKSYHTARHSAPVIARRPSAEAEAAKEKVIFALQITSDALNDVQRAISDERAPAEHPEPVHNR